MGTFKRANREEVQAMNKGPIRHIASIGSAPNGAYVVLKLDDGSRVVMRPEHFDVAFKTLEEALGINLTKPPPTA